MKVKFEMVGGKEIEVESDLEGKHLRQALMDPVVKWLWYGEDDVNCINLNNVLQFKILEE